MENRLLPQFSYLKRLSWLASATQESPIKLLSHTEQTAPCVSVAERNFRGHPVLPKKAPLNRRAVRTVCSAGLSCLKGAFLGSQTLWLASQEKPLLIAEPY